MGLTDYDKLPSRSLMFNEMVATCINNRGYSDGVGLFISYLILPDGRQLLSLSFAMSDTHAIDLCRNKLKQFPSTDTVPFTDIDDAILDYMYATFPELDENSDAVNTKIVVGGLTYLDVLTKKFPYYIVAAIFETETGSFVHLLEFPK